MSDESDMERGTVELLVAKGYWKAVGAKLLHVINETFCSIPTDGANCCYLVRLISKASVARCQPAKNGGSGNSVSAASPMIKLAKRWIKGIREFVQLELHIFPS